jgi:hypothetical protein
MKGIRYYMPRAYIAAKRRFPISIETVLLSGRVVGGTFTADLPQTLERELGVRSVSAPWAGSLPPSRANAQALGAGAADPGKPSGGEADKPAGDAKPAEDKDAKADDEKKESTTAGPGVAINGGNAEFVSRIPAEVSPMLDVSDFYDVIYLPDYDEQYVMDVHGRLGKASLESGLRYGWMLEGARLSEDNTEIAKFVFGEIQEFTKMARRAIELKISPETAVVEAMGGGATRGGNSGPVAQSFGARSAPAVFEATARLHIVKMANVGVHPVLKPFEINEALRSARPGTCTQALPVQYNCSTEVYLEALGARPADPAPAAVATPSVPTKPRPDDDDKMPGEDTDKKPPQDESW